jgi:hypothetical protein
MTYLIASKYLQRGHLQRPDHADMRYKCRTYARLLQFIKVFGCCLVARLEINGLWVLPFENSLYILISRVWIGVV